MLLPHDADVAFVRYMPDTTLAATATVAGTLHLWSWESGSKVGSANRLHEGVIVGLEVHEGLIFTAGEDGLLKVSFFEPPCHQCKLFWNDWITCGFDLSKDGKLAASGDDGANVKVWDLATGGYMDLKGHGDEVYGCGFSPDNKLLASGGAEKLVCVWNLASGGSLVHKLDMQIDGQLANVWNPITGERLHSLDYLRFPGQEDEEDLEPIAVPMRRWSFCDFNPSGTHLAVAANAQGVLVWDAQAWQLQRVLILQPGVELGTVRWSPSGKQIATASNSQNAVAGVFGLESDEPVWVRDNYGAKGGEAHRRYLGWTHHACGSRFVMTTTGGLALISAENGDMLSYTPSMHYKNVQMAPDDKMAVGVYNGRHGTQTFKGGVVAWTVFSSGDATMDWEHYECVQEPVIGPDQPLAPVVLDHEGYSLAMRAIMKGEVAFLKLLLATVQPGAHTLRVTSAAHKDAALLAAVRSTDREMLNLLMEAWEQGKLMHTTTDTVALFWPLLMGVRKLYPSLFVRFLEHGPTALGPVQWQQPEQQPTVMPLIPGSSDMPCHHDPAYLWGSGQVIYGKAKVEKQQTVKVTMEAKVLPLVDTLSMAATHNLLHLLTDRSPPLPLDTYNLPAVRALIRLKWEVFARSLSLREFGLHLCLVVAFSMFGVLLPEVIQTQPGGGTDVVGGRTGTRAASLVFLGLAACFTLWEVYQKALQWWRLGTHRMWLGNPFFDLLDIISFMLLGAIVPLYLVCSCNPERDSATQDRLVSALVTTAAIESTMVWARVLYFMLAYQATGPLVRMIVHIIRDISFFLVLLLCTLLGFGLSFYLLFNFSVMVGNFSQDMFWNARSPVLAVALFVLYIIVMLVVLFNLLIAILSDSFERVKDTEEVEFLKGSDPTVTGIAAEAAVGGGQWLGRLRETERRVARLVAASEARVMQKLNAMEGRMAA
ncbi:hypothetical protein GPECTOR_40g601 [Gonium pectorale]|uniref:Uncharacterized protein n=1 Tax=Gonium pectorale TaxID=33097 RepID=A0A150GAJ4_GONPE|nr:hypothetical protein GPECTOR_40g601 [Gonium pectorale]|eukprot:KXZ46867.1 hypothetical protein GPECTOR_40g601 [Gonium pectorale]